MLNWFDPIEGIQLYILFKITDMKDDSYNRRGYVGELKLNYH